MSNLRLRRFARGTPVTALRNDLNKIVDRLNGSDVPSGSVALLGFPPVPLMQLEIRALNASTLTCHLPGQALNPSAQTWKVELPPTLTESSRDGVSYVYTDINNRTADGAEVQKLTPIYILDDTVYVATIVATGTYVDVNVDGRQWARVP